MIKYCLIFIWPHSVKEHSFCKQESLKLSLPVDAINLLLEEGDVIRKKITWTMEEWGFTVYGLQLFVKLQDLSGMFSIQPRLGGTLVDHTLHWWGGSSRSQLNMIIDSLTTCTSKKKMVEKKQTEVECVPITRQELAGSSSLLRPIYCVSNHKNHISKQGIQTQQHQP